MFVLKHYKIFVPTVWCSPLKFELWCLLSK